MKVLVSGAAGYVGSHTARELIRRGHQVVALDDLSTGHGHSLEALEIELLEVDLTDQAAVTQALAKGGFDACCHMAAFPLVPHCESNPARAWSINVAGGLNLLDACLAAKVNRFVMTSSAAVYGNPSRSPTPETQPRRPVSVYGRTKSALEDAVRDYARGQGLRAVMLRVFNVAGAEPDGILGEDHDPETHLIPCLLQVASAGNGKVQIFGDDFPTEDGTTVRDYTHVLDVARAHALALETLADSAPEAGDSGQATSFNVGTGTATSVLEVIAGVERVTGKKLDVTIKPARIGDPARLVADVAKARERLDFVATNSALEEMIESAWLWQCKLSGKSTPKRARRPASATATKAPRARTDSSGLPTKTDSSRQRAGSGRQGSPRRSPRFGESAQMKGFITEDQLQNALTFQRERDERGESHKLLGIILLEMGAMDNTQLIELLQDMSTAHR